MSHQPRRVGAGGQAYILEDLQSGGALLPTDILKFPLLVKQDHIVTELVDNFGHIASIIVKTDLDIIFLEVASLNHNLIGHQFTSPYTFYLRDFVFVF